MQGSLNKKGKKIKRKKKEQSQKRKGSVRDVCLFAPFALLPDLEGIVA
jgi:hypothetical protein